MAERACTSNRQVDGGPESMYAYLAVAVELKLCRRVAAHLVERSYSFGNGSPGRSGGHLAAAVTRLPTGAQTTRGGLYDAHTMTDLPTVLPN